MKPKQKLKRVIISKVWEELPDKTLHLVTTPISKYIRKLEQQIIRIKCK